MSATLIFVLIAVVAPMAINECYAYRLRRPYRFGPPSLPVGRPKYRTDGELFDDAVPLAAPAVIGQVHYNTSAEPRQGSARTGSRRATLSTQGSG